MRKYYDQIYVNTFDSLDGMNKSLSRHELQDRLNHLDGPTSIKSNALLKTVTEKILGSDNCTGNPTKCEREESQGL